MSAVTVPEGSEDRRLTAAPAAAGLRRRPGGPVPLWWRDASAVLAWLSVLFVVALWVAGGGLTAFGSLGEALINLGRLTGLVASVLLLLQVLLMARIPFVEQAWGQDELARVHRLVGFTSFNLMLAHIVLTVLGYSAGTDLGFVATFIDQVLHSPGMLLALAGTVALVLVVVTSVRKARARLRYESWHLLHLYAYLGAGLALPHQLWTGADFRSSVTATVFWWGLYAAALGSVIAFRVVLPLVRSLRHRLVVSEVVAESPTVTSIVMTGRRLDRLPARAGQFFQWRFLDGPGWSRAHPYSLSAAPDGRSLRITAEHVGDASARLAALRRGTKVLVEGPYGRLHAGVRTRDKQVLIAAGIGITPMRALLEELPAGPDATVVIYRVGSQADVVLAAELLDLARAKGARVVAVVGHRQRDRASWLPAEASRLGDGEALTRIVPDIADRDVYICGNPAWMDTVIAAAKEVGVPSTSIHHERFSY
ncbi:oxidoreductase [Intrasporangium oryzae NRRL B-24470]|uniref:Oxidoreductase n=1 Tax=Intrasporangium oryzae NRRL B-24470 TaxID=1386089 RepID=W9G698_9MICO|nr:ferric reductase-like transmembrane domain-containing protein [Intrasporangium oryzae]EWT00333.1 oxidoreductase [Intrasporangium oryzae NRRL B-24470]